MIKLCGLFFMALSFKFQGLNAKVLLPKFWRGIGEKIYNQGSHEFLVGLYFLKHVTTAVFRPASSLFIGKRRKRFKLRKKEEKAWNQGETIEGKKDKKKGNRQDPMQTPKNIYQCPKIDEGDKSKNKRKKLISQWRKGGENEKKKVEISIRKA